MRDRGHRRYIVTETVISVLINTAISIGFVYLVFGHMPVVPAATLIPDAVPQSFMIGLMSTVVPTLLTRRRVAGGHVASIEKNGHRLPKSWPLRALLVAVIAAISGIMVTAAFVMALFPEGLDFHHTLIVKAIYGAGLALALTPIIVRAALAD